MNDFNQQTYMQALMQRDAGFDGRFVFGVSSTKIYCRPSCPARRGRQENIALFASPAEAEGAGFRACLRCHPKKTAGSDPQVELARRACRLIEARPDEQLSLADLGAELKVSPYHLQRTFKSVTGVSPRQYAEAHRINRFKTHIKDGDGVAGAMYQAGFGSSSRLYERAGPELGMTPAVYARGGAGMHIIYTVVGCELGRLLVAATQRGLCAVTLGDTDEELERTLLTEFSAAEISRDAAALGDWVEVILLHLEGRQAALDLPVDVRATAFQRRVWEELRRIPYGETRSYKQVAAGIGQPAATRAVARACAANPVALVTPCHRVIRGDGASGGYRWGVGRKERLLALERQSSR